MTGEPAVQALSVCSRVIGIVVSLLAPTLLIRAPFRLLRDGAHLIKMRALARQNTSVLQAMTGAERHTLINILQIK